MWWWCKAIIAWVCWGFSYLDELAGSEYAGSGNQGILDIVAALAWVNRNIGVFGGDPNNVMIFGESGGGAKTSCLYAMPAAAPYFNKASIESGPGVRMYTPETGCCNHGPGFEGIEYCCTRLAQIAGCPSGRVAAAPVEISPCAAISAEAQSGSHHRTCCRWFRSRGGWRRPAPASI